MGSADVVPGVSGGTIAFIAGIYEELISSINNINLKALTVLKNEGIAPFWKQINGNFFSALLGGIAVAIVSLAKIITYLLDTQPVLIWAFFFGLVFASIFFVGKRVKSWKANRVLFFILGAAIAYVLTSLPAQPESGALWFIFISGMIAICAMILPGISGSFILLLLGSYQVILASIHDRNIVLILTFMVGAVIGLLSFSRLLKWMFTNYHDITIAVLSGFLLGSLNKIWPWKETLSTYVKHAGEPNEKIVPLEQINVLPQAYETATGMPAETGMAIGLFVVGMALIIGMEVVSNKTNEA